jgi:glyoxylase I family protein
VIGADGAPDQVVFLCNGRVYLELFAGASSDGKRPVADGPHLAAAVRHLAFQVDDVDGLVAAMGADADLTLGPLQFDEFIPGWRTVWLRDPDGVVVEVSQGYRDA